MDNINDKINALDARLETIRNAENEYFWQMASKYGTNNWMYDRSVQADREDIRRFYDMKAKGDALQKELSGLINIVLRADEEEEERKRQETATEYEQSKTLFACAANEYGTTENPNEAGYILPDGSMLDFSGGEGIRDTDHRNITGAFRDAGIQLPDNWDRTDAMCDFIRRGAIRYIPQCNGFNMCQEPTQQQYRTIKQIIRQMGGNTDIDFDDNDGNTLLSVHYNNTTPQRLEYEIYRYFNEGIKPQGDAWENRMRRRLTEDKEDRLLDTRDLLNDLKQAKTRAEIRLVRFNREMCRKYGTRDWLNKYGFDHENNDPTEDAMTLLTLDTQAADAEYEFENFKRTLGIKENRKHDMNKKKTIYRITENDVRRMVKEAATRILREVKVRGESGKEYSLHGNDKDSWMLMRRVREKLSNFIDDIVDQNNRGANLAFDTDYAKADSDMNRRSGYADLDNARSTKEEEPEGLEPLEDIDKIKHPAARRRAILNNRERERRNQYRRDEFESNKQFQWRDAAEDVFNGLADNYNTQKYEKR